MRFEILECTHPGCLLRFPRSELDPPTARCPRCGSSLRVAACGTTRREENGQRVALPFEVLVDNVRSAFNVGTILRSSDAAGVRLVHLCGVTPTPEHRRVAKTALGAERALPWRTWPNTLAAAEALRASGVSLWALEEGHGATSLFEMPLPRSPLALVVGNEVTGIDPVLLERADAVVCLPMRGTKRSLNVAVAFGAAAVLVAERIAASSAGI